VTFKKRGPVELRQLQLLRAVIESGGYTPAGKLLHVSHSAIHRQIRMLEQELGCCLLARSGRKVKATESGRLLADLNLRIRQEILDARRQVNELNNLRRGFLRIGTSSSILVSFLPAVLQRFSSRFPGVRLHLVTGIADDLIEAVMEGKLDLGILFNPADLPRPLPELDCRILYREEFEWAVARSHPLAKRHQVALPELAAYPLIAPPPRSHIRRACDRLFAANGLVPTVITEVENEEAIDKLIEVNLGFAARSRRRPPNGKIHCFRIPNGTIQCEVGIILRKRNYAHRAFIEFLRVCRQVKMPLYS
jgi:LysR family cyn operon transcriptional activator